MKNRALVRGEMKLSEKINHLHHNIQELENAGQFDYNEAYEILEEVREALERAEW